MRPPRVSIITFTSYICCIYALKFGQYWTSFCVGNSSVSSTPYIQFLFVRPRFCRRLPSDSASRRTPLPLANSSYCQACSGLSPPSYYACRAHNICRLIIFEQTAVFYLFRFKQSLAKKKLSLRLLRQGRRGALQAPQPFCGALFR